MSTGIPKMPFGMPPGMSNPDGSPIDAEKDKLPRLTPMELDIQLQAAELIFRAILEGKRPGICYPTDINQWYRDVLGDAWVEDNNEQRKIVHRQAQEEGEHTPMWTEAVGHMGDIAWDVLEAGLRGEKVRDLSTIDRKEIITQFEDLYPKVRDSHYARCGAGDRMYGLRACVAIFRLFPDDHEVLGWMVKCLTFIISANDVNRDALCELTLVLPPDERSDQFRDCGWSFLRAVLDAFMVQAGASKFDVATPTEGQALIQADDGAAEQDEAESAIVVHDEDGVDRTPQLDVAIRIAECVLATRVSPAMVAQLSLLQQQPSENSPIERHELTQILPAVRLKLTELLTLQQQPILQYFLDMLQNDGSHDGALSTAPLTVSGSST